MRRGSRILITALALAALPGPAFSQTKPAASPAAPKPAVAAPKPDPAFDLAKLAAEALGPDAIAQIQADLIWTGDLNRLAGGEFGRRTYDGIRAFQTRSKGKDTGVLLPAERTRLDAEAARAQAAYGFRTVTAQGVSVGYPARLATKRTEGDRGPKFSSPTGNVTVDILRFAAADEAFDALFARLKTPRAGRTVSYSLLRPDFFVVSGVTDGKSFYMRFLKTDSDARGFVVGWDPALSPGFDRVPIAMAGSLALEGAAASTAAAPAQPAAASPKASGPPVPLAAGASKAPKNGIGVLVSDKGDVLTGASLVAGCTSVVMADGGTGLVVAGDASGGPALVRLAAAPKAPPLALRGAPLAAGDAVRLLGSGGRQETTVAALSGPGEDTRRVTLAAASGAPLAVVDAQGALAGLVAAPDAPAAVKAAFLSAFLRANGVTPPAGDTGDPAAGIVALTCTPR